MVKNDDDDISPPAGSGETHTALFDSWHWLEQFEPEWEDIGFDDLGLNWPDHLFQGNSTDVSQPDHQPAAATVAASVTGFDHELVNAQPTCKEVSGKLENTKTPKKEIEEPPGRAELPHRPEKSRPLVTPQSRSDSGISRESSTSNSIRYLTPCSSSASAWTSSRHGSRHPTPPDFSPSTGGRESLVAPRLEGEFYADRSLFSYDVCTFMGNYDLSEQQLGVSPWAGLRDTGLTDDQSAVQALTDESHSSFLYVLAEQASMAAHDTIASYPASASTTGEPPLLIPVCLSPSLNQAPMGLLLDLGTNDRQQAKRKRDKDETENRTRTRKVRDLGACLRCRIYKEKCDLNVPCGRCTQVIGSVKLFKQPCQRVDLADVIPFRTGNARMGKTSSVFPKLSWSLDSQIRTTSVTHFVEGVDVALLPKLKLICGKFNPTDDDVLFEHYEDADGKVMVVPCPPVACINIETQKTRQAVEGYMKNILPFAIKEILTTSKDEIYRQGLAEANRLAYASSNPIPMLQKALEILACVHLNFDTPILMGDTLDVPILRDKRSPIQGRYPVPSVLDFQLDTLCIHHMQKLMKAVSRSLKKLIFSKERQSRWYEIFLTIFVLLVSIEQVYLTQCEYLRGATIANDGDNIFAQASPVTSYMLSLWRASAKYLLYHYRCVMKGGLPFSPSFKLEGEGYALLDADARQYIRKTAALVREREAELNAVRDKNFDNMLVQPLSWISELFLE